MLYPAFEAGGLLEPLPPVILVCVVVYGPHLRNSISVQKWL